jgi:hypothetical protein
MSTYSKLEGILKEGNIVEFVNNGYPWDLGEKVLHKMFGIPPLQINQPRNKMRFVVEYVDKDKDNHIRLRCLDTWKETIFVGWLADMLHIIEPVRENPDADRVRLEVFVDGLKFE